MDDDEDCAWLCTQAMVDDIGQNDGNNKTNNFGCIVLNDMVNNKYYVLKEGDNTIGRHPLNHIYIEHPSVSINHAVIQCDCDGIVLLDKGSLNKTKLNTKTLKKNVAYFLDENALLAFGEVRANYYVDGDPSKTTKESNGISAQKMTEKIGSSISKLSSSITTSNNSTSKMEINVLKTHTKSEYITNTNLDDKELNSSPSDIFLLDTISQIESMETNINLFKTVHSLKEKTPSPAMNFKKSMSSIASEKNSLHFSNNDCGAKKDNISLYYAREASNKVICKIALEDTPSPTMDQENPLLDIFSTIKKVGTIECQPSKQINTKVTREDTSSPVMDLGLFGETKNRLSTIETNNHNIFSINESTNNIDLDETQCLEVDNNILGSLAQKSLIGNISNTDIQQLSSFKLANSTSVNSQQNMSKNYFNTFDADDDDIFSSFIEQESTSQLYDLISHNTDDFFNCSTQKVLTSKNIDFKLRAPSTRHKIKTQELPQPSETSVVMSKIDDEDFFNCPTQKVSISKNLNLKINDLSTVYKTETQEFLQPSETNVITSKTSTTNIHKNLTIIQEIDDEDFFNYPTQKVSISKKTNLKANVSSTIHKIKLQEISQFPPYLTNVSTYKTSNNSIQVDLTQIPEIDDEDFFDCPTQKVSISKKINLKANVSSAMHKAESQEMSQFPPNLTIVSTSKTNKTGIHEDLTQVPEINDEDFFDCPTQKVSISKKKNLKTNFFSTIHKAEPKEISQLPPNLANISTFKTSNNSIHENLTQVHKLEDDDFFNCPTQKLSISKNINSKFSSTIYEAEMQEYLSPSETNIITSETCVTNVHENLTEKQEIDNEDFLNCPTQKIASSKRANTLMNINRQGTDTLDINDIETQDLLTQSNSTISISKMILPNKINQNKENIYDQMTQKVPITIQSNTISYKCINSDVDGTKDSIDNYNEYKSINPKRAIVSNQTNERKIRKSERIGLNTISKLNNQLPNVYNKIQNSSNSLKTNKKPQIRVRKDLQTYCSINLSNRLSNKTNNKSVQNVLLSNDTANENIDLPSDSIIVNNRKTDPYVSFKEELLTDDSIRCQLLNSRHKYQSGQFDETIIGLFNIPNISSNSSSEQHLTPMPVKDGINSLISEQSTSSGNKISKWQSFWNKANQNPGKLIKQLNNIKSNNEVMEKKEKYQTRAITKKESALEFNRKRKQDSVGVDKSNKKMCNKDRTCTLLLNPLTESSLETVVTFSYLKNRHLQEMKQFVDKTGGSVTDEITQCTVLVTDKIRCTMKILSAIARGCPIVNTNWIKHSYTVKSFQDVNEFIITDKDAERKYNFRLKDSLVKARTNRLLDGYTVLVTPSVKPGPKDMKVIITCAGGHYVMMWPKTRVRKELIVTCEQDHHQWKPMWNNDMAKVIDSNALVMCLIRQKLNV